MNKKILTILAVLAVALAGLFVYSSSRSEIPDNSQYDNDVRSVSAIEFAELAKDKDAFLLDVHIPEQSHIPGTDAFIPYDKISQNIEKLPKNKDTQILLYCRSGSMSREAAYKLQEMGYTNVVDLAGGINEYKESFVSVAITPETQDLGTVVYGDVATTTFTLTNFTPTKLNITKVSTSCGCTKAQVVSEQLEAYESTDVIVSFDPAVHKDDTDLGDITRTIFIDTDNPNFAQVTATITANVNNE